MKRYVELDQRLMKDKNINATECILYLYLKESKCISTGKLDIKKVMEDLPAFFLKKDTLYRVYKSLCKNGLIKPLAYSYEQTYYILNKNNSDKGCRFCGSEKNLHNHHYPIRKSDGGRKTITLCDKCHYEFHSIADYSHRFTIAEKDAK